MNRNSIAYSLFIILLFMVSCTGTRQLAQGELLMRKGALEIESSSKSRDLSEVKLEMLKAINVSENSKIFWMRPRLSLHSMFKEQEKEKGFKHWMKYKLGAPPYKYNKQTISRLQRTIENHLFNYGFFNASVDVELKQSKKQVKPYFIINTGNLYRITSNRYQPSGFNIDSVIIELNKDNTNKIGSPYKLNRLISNRANMAERIMDEGYYYFRADHLEYVADTNTNSSNGVDLILRLKANNPKEAYEQYRLNKVIIEDNYKIEQTKVLDTLEINNLSYISPIKYINPKVVANTIHLQADSLYSRVLHLRTLNHIRALNVYKFVNINYQIDDTMPGVLNTRIILMPLEKMSFNGELNASFKSNNYAGPGVLLSFSNRNTFKNAELLNVSFGGKFEAQIGQNILSNVAYEFRIDSKLQMPRLYPFKSKKVQRRHIPKTSINLGAGIQERVEYFQMLTGNVGLLYLWKTSDRLQQQVSPYEITLSQLLRKTDEFAEYLEENPSVRRSFEEQFILGPSYEIYINSSVHRRSPLFLGLNLDMSGNIISGAYLVAGSSEKREEAKNKFFGIPYSQYIRGRADFRYNLKIAPQHNLAFRLISGVGYPYGNSSIMPYIKQYFVGGANSLRGFPARTIGPGTFFPQELDGLPIVIDQAGDIKLETNLEYRFPMYSFLKGAVFADIGNIWLVNADSTRPGGQFNPRTFYQEFAISTGFGLRLDFSPILFRFDFGWPLRYPFPVKGNNWVLSGVNLFNGEWRKRNVILNISLGYPF